MASHSDTGSIRESLGVALVFPIIRQMEGHSS